MCFIACMHCSALTKYRIYTYCGGPIYYGDLRYMAEKGLICCGILDCSSETFMLEEWSLGAWAELRHTCHTILYTIAYVSNICLFLLCVYTQSVALWIPINYDCTLHLAKQLLLTDRSLSPLPAPCCTFILHSQFLWSSSTSKLSSTMGPMLGPLAVASHTANKCCRVLSMAVMKCR